MGNVPSAGVQSTKKPNTTAPAVTPGNTIPKRNK